MALDLSTLTTEQQIAAIYIGYYERAGEPDGANFWEAVLENPAFSLADIASDFAVQTETLEAHPFFENPTAEAANAFLASLYGNLFAREADVEGLEFWSPILVGVINGETFDSDGDGVDDITQVGDIILAIIEGAQDVAGGAQDRTAILNKINVAVSWTNAAEEAGQTAAFAELSSAVQTSAFSIIAGVTADPATKTAAEATIDSFFEPVGTPGETFALRVGVDALTGTADDDLFVAQIAQSEFVGGISNTLATGDMVDGGAGNDRMVANVTSEFAGTNLSDLTDIHALIKNVEEIDIRATDSGSDFFFDQEIIIDGGVVGGDGVYFNGILGHNEIGSYFSDGDLKIENLTTYDANGVARNTSEITIAMDHTDNFNSDFDASDLTVYFDNDYLLSGETSVGTADFFLLDQDAELRILRGQAAEGRLDEIDKNGIRFEINGEEVTVEFDGALLSEDSPEEINSHDAFIQALQADLAAKIADGTLPAGTQIVRFDYAEVIFDDDGLALNRAGLQDGSFSNLIPAIQVVSGDGSPVTPLGFTAPDEITGEFNIFGRFDAFADTDDQPISIDIDLHKVGRGAEGGDLIVGGKAQQSTNEGIAGGIEVFNISVKGVGGEGADAKPSNVGTITSTLNALKTVNIVTDPMFAQGDSFASLVIRNGFDQDEFNNVESGDLELVNASGFLGNLTLGDPDAFFNDGRITNLDTLTALGGGDVEFNAFINGVETNQEYNYSTGSGDDTIDVIVDGDALDYADSALRITSGGGDDDISVVFNINADPENNQLNQAIIDDVIINGEGGNDTIEVDGVGVANILGGEGNDVIYTDGTAPTAAWALNFDDARGPFLAGTDGEDLPGVQPSLAYIGGAEVTITLSGAGLGSIFAGGGVMAFAGADPLINGYEVTTTISNLINGNEYYGDQRDINEAVIDAINNDDILKHLLEAKMGANNTVYIESLTSGVFGPDDLRISIDQADATTTAYAESVLSEAQREFNDSSLTLTELWGTTSFSSTSPAQYEAGAPAGEAGDLRSSVGADMWYDGLSVAGQANTMANNLLANGVTDGTENDNVINGGAGNDLIVLSTDAADNFPAPFTVSSQNALINGASNETIVMTGSNFGNDTVMNFTTTVEDVTAPDVTITTIGSVAYTLGASVAVANEPGITSFVVLNGVLTTGDPLLVALAEGDDAATIIEKVAVAINTDPNSAFSAATDGALELTVTSDDPFAFPASSVDFTAEDRTGSGIVTLSLDGADIGAFVLGSPISATIPGSDSGDLDAGLDFLDFTAYLTSQFDSSLTSTATTDSDDSNVLIPVTLDFGIDNTLAGDVDANEVAVVRMAGDAGDGESFAGLTAEIVEDLFNDTLSDTDNTFGDLAEGAFDVDLYDKTATNEELIGDAKAIFMVENAANLGEYKVFELTWDGTDETGEDGDVVTASLLGSLDFGTSLTGLADVNIVGTEAYNDLLDDGFFAP